MVLKWIWNRKSDCMEELALQQSKLCQKLNYECCWESTHRKLNQRTFLPTSNHSMYWMWVTERNEKNQKEIESERERVKEKKILFFCNCWKWRKRALLLYTASVLFSSVVCRCVCIASAYPIKIISKVLIMCSFSVLLCTNFSQFADVALSSWCCTISVKIQL